MLYTRIYFTKNLIFTLLVILSVAAFRSLCAEPAPALKLANTYRDDLPLEEYLFSEKYDGVRAFWDGRKLVSRRGNRFNPPVWFSSRFGNRKLDGELWLGRGQFERLSGIVRRKDTSDQDWQEIRYMVFDLPDEAGPFWHRYQVLKTLLAQSESPYLHLVEQYPVIDKQSLMAELKSKLADGAEGLMLQHRHAPYRGKRSDDLIKLKAWQDAEARVLQHLPGKGKYTGMLGALLVETGDGLQFRIGTGFSDAQRRDPPPLGSLITYRYTGKSKYGTPRFASFVRIRKLH